MKLVTGIVASLVIGSLSFGVFAAKELEKDKVAGMNLTKIGEISTSDTTAPMDARKELSKKADELGGRTSSTSAEKQTKNVRATRTSISNKKPGSALCPALLTQRPPLPEAGLSFRQLLQLPERQPSLFLNPHGFPHGFQSFQHGIDHRLRRMQAEAQLFRLHPPCRASISRT
jgi:hypothetical protein